MNNNKDLENELLQETENSETIVNEPEQNLNTDEITGLDKNAIFFEKFEKSKKDFLKEKRKDKLLAKRKISNQNKMLGFQSRLREEDFTKKLWIIFVMAGVLLLAYSCVVVAFLGNKFNGTTDNKWVYANYFLGMTKTSVIFSGISIVLIPLPYLYMCAAWFIGINNVHQSKYFVTTNIVFLVISLVLTIIVIPMSSYIFNQTIGFLPLGSSAS